MKRQDCLFAASVTLSLMLGACGSSGPVDVLPQEPGGDTATIRVLSNRADLISDDDALIEILDAAGDIPSSATVTLNGRDVSPQFARRGNGRYMGLLEGLQAGENHLRARLADGSQVATTIVNHSRNGPVFGPPKRKQLWCQETAVDGDCNQPVEYRWLYKSSNPLRPDLQAYDPEHPPSDVASTTTAHGVTLPFIVREERGYLDRDEYLILTLFNPDEDWQPWAPQAQWNRKLVIPGGGGCGVQYGPATAPLRDYSGTFPEGMPLEQSYVTALGRGFAVLSSALANTGHNCDVVTNAEALMMVKERFVEQYGELRYTIGTGCSGGSILQATVANAYPGIYQGLLTMCSYPDSMTAAAQFADYHLLRKYFEAPARWAPGVVWLPTQWSDVEGHLTHLNAIVADIGLFVNATNPVGGCYGGNSYHPQDNPGGVRCSVQDYLAHIFGLREPADWSPMEQAAGKGFAALPLGNTGVQYGLETLLQGRITPAQFVDLNVKIGGLDIDIQPQAARTPGDARAIGNAYRSGTVNVATHLDTVPIINFVGLEPGLAHDAVHAWWTRWRIERAHGHHDNHVMWTGPVPLIGDLNFIYQGLDAMDRWLAAIEQDGSHRPIAEKIVANKPTDVRDRCSDGLGQTLLNDVCVDLLQPVLAYSTPRGVAGDARYGDSMQCRLKPFSRDGYGLAGLLFTEAQWQQLETVFADGVCDYDQPPLEIQPTLTWLKYTDGNGRVIVGGEPLPPAPPHSRGGWSSPAFAY